MAAAGLAADLAEGGAEPEPGAGPGAGPGAALVILNFRISTEIVVIYYIGMTSESHLMMLGCSAHLSKSLISLILLSMKSRVTSSLSKCQ